MADNNKAKKSGKEKKLTAVERRRLEREERRRRAGSYSADIDDDSVFGDLENFGGAPEYGEVDDYYSRNFGDFANETETPEQRMKRERRENREKEKQEEDLHANIRPASTMTAEQRKRRTVISYVSVFVLLVLIGVVMSMSVMFRTTVITVDGDTPYSDEQIIETSGIDYGENIFLSKRRAAVKKLVETYPYIEDAKIIRRIPGTQIIKLEPAIPSYQVQFSGGFAVVSANCRILEINDVQKNGIPLLKGIKLDHTQPGEYITFEKASTRQILDEVVKNIVENEVGNIYGIDISDTANIELNYDNRITIHLGLPEDVGYKLRTAKAIINDSLTAADKGNLDVSLCNTDRRASYFTPIYSDTVSQGDTSGRSDNAPEDNEQEYREYIDDIID